VTLQYSLLDETLIRARLVDGGQSVQYSLPGLFVALARDEVRDFPSLRPHQRHPWHAFLVQLAAMALHHAGRDQPFETEQEWKNSLLALTPEHPDGAAWCLITPHDKPAFMQAPVPGGKVDDWKSVKDKTTIATPDELDMLITSKNHDLKAARMRRGELDDWVMALISLQTQEGSMGSGKFGISRMNSGYGSRPGVGIVSKQRFGKRWSRDVSKLLAERENIVEIMGLKERGGIGLVWLKPWDGSDSLSFGALDPFYIEICRRIRLQLSRNFVISAIGTGSQTQRIAAKERNGITGDPWTPIDIAEKKALTISVNGFNYQLAADLLCGKYSKPIAQEILATDGTNGLAILAQGVARGGGKTGGYHERRIPISSTVRKMFIQKQTDVLAKVAEYRVNAIDEMSSVLRASITTLFDNGKPQEGRSTPKGLKQKVGVFIKQFEQAEDSCFFDELNAEIESVDPDKIRLQWLLSMAERAEAVLKNAFIAGPQSGEQRYRVQSAALSKFHGGLRSDKALPSLANYFRHTPPTKENAHEPV
jgi:CRISPR system Cascade subunit CasA